MLIELITTWNVRNSGGVTTATGTGTAFDTDTKKVVPFNQTRQLGMLDPAPANVRLPAGYYIWSECGADYAQTKWFFNGTNDTTTTVTADSPDCGWSPPVEPVTCDLVLDAEALGDTITATTSGAHGNVTYSIDGGVTRQASGVFKNLVARAYVVEAYDDGPTDCRRSQTVFVTAPIVTALPVAGAMPDVGFTRNPLALVATATLPGRSLLVELWVETFHGSANYKRMVQRVRPTDAQGRAVLQLQDQLHAVLTGERPDLAFGAQLTRLTSSIRRYYAAIAEVQPASGLPGPFVFQSAATALRGGLPWVTAKVGAFFSPLPGFLTWRPAAFAQVVGLGHVALLSRLLPADAVLAKALVRCYRRGSGTPHTTRSFELPLATSGTPSPTLGSLTPYLVQLQVPVDELPTDTHRFDVEFLADGVPQPGRVRYELDRARPHRHFIFRNSLGQWDTLSCPGPVTSKVSVERTVATYLVQPDYDPQGGSESVASLAVESKMTASTGGNLAPAELAHLRELLLSREVYEVNSSRLLRPIRLTSKEFIDYQDNAGTDGFAFEYTYCFDTSLFDNDRITNL
jgi:hypothetical protein